MILKLTYTNGVYRDAEDSWLLQEQVKKYAKKEMKVLDVGTGTGIQAITAAKQGADVMAVDINPKAVELAKKNAELNNVKINILESDLFLNVKGKFDLIIFNAPYLPSDEPPVKQTELWEGVKDPAWSGGKELIMKFIKEAKKYLNKDGKIIIVFSSLTKLDIEGIEILDSKRFEYHSTDIYAERIGIDNIYEEIYVGLIK